MAEPCIGTPEEQEIQKKNRATAAAEHEKRRNLLIMKLFYLLPYDGEKDFYEQFEIHPLLKTNPQGCLPAAVKRQKRFDRVK